MGYFFLQRLTKIIDLGKFIASKIKFLNACLSDMKQLPGVHFFQYLLSFMFFSSLSSFILPSLPTSFLPSYLPSSLPPFLFLSFPSSFSSSSSFFLGVNQVFQGSQRVSWQTFNMLVPISNWLYFRAFLLINILSTSWPFPFLFHASDSRIHRYFQGKGLTHGFPGYLC